MPRVERYRGRRVRARSAENLTEALDALCADELRKFVSDALNRLDDGPRTELEDMLLARAVRSPSGWKPAAPSAGFVEEAKTFVAAARRVGQADPGDVDDYLRRAINASLAGDHASARAVFAMLLEPISNGDIFLGQNEMVEEVLSVDLHECARRFVTAVYTTTPLDGRAEAVLKAIDSVKELSDFRDPVDDIANVFAGEVPDVKAFVQLWIGQLEREAKSGSEWESDHERWLRAAVGRRDGIAGLERLARTTKRPEAARAWCDALVAAGDWTKARSAYEECAAMIEADHWRGDFLDGAALAAQVLGSKDVGKKLEAAWLGAPSLLRLVRWLLAGEPAAALVRKRAATALGASPTAAARIMGLLNLLVGNVSESAKMLAKAPGLGWSQPDHPGHVLFPAFAWLLGGAPTGSLREELAMPLFGAIRDRFEYEEVAASGMLSTSMPQLPVPSIIDSVERSDLIPRLSHADRILMFDAMKAAATRRTDGVLGEKRRRHYGHAAKLIACCVELDKTGSKTAATLAWAEGLRARTSRFPAFQQELREALTTASGPTT